MGKTLELRVESELGKGAARGLADRLVVVFWLRLMPSIVAEAAGVASGGEKSIMVTCTSGEGLARSDAVTAETHGRLVGARIERSSATGARSRWDRRRGKRGSPLTTCWSFCLEIQRGEHDAEPLGRGFLLENRVG